MLHIISLKHCFETFSMRLGIRPETIILTKARTTVSRSNNSLSPRPFSLLTNTGQRTSSHAFARIQTTDSSTFGKMEIFQHEQYQETVDVLQTWPKEWTAIVSGLISPRTRRHVRGLKYCIVHSALVNVRNVLQYYVYVLGYLGLLGNRLESEENCP